VKHGFFKGATSWEAYVGPIWVTITYPRFWWQMPEHSGKTFWSKAVRVGWEA